MFKCRKMRTSFLRSFSSNVTKKYHRKREMMYLFDYSFRNKICSHLNILNHLNLNLWSEKHFLQIKLTLNCNKSIESSLRHSRIYYCLLHRYPILYTFQCVLATPLQCSFLFMSWENNRGWFQHCAPAIHEGVQKELNIQGFGLNIPAVTAT